MKCKAVICAIAALSMGVSGLAVAQRDDHRDNDRHEMRDRDRHDNGRHVGEERREDRHHWRRGDRLPDEYRSRQYVVDDWRGHHLSAPPRGYHWVQANGDYVLVAIASGVIASILLNQ